MREKCAFPIQAAQLEYSSVECQDSIRALSGTDRAPIHWADAQPVARGADQPGGVLAAPIGVQDDPGDRVAAAAYHLRLLGFAEECAVRRDTERRRRGDP